MILKRPWLLLGVAALGSIGVGAGAVARRRRNSEV